MVCVQITFYIIYIFFFLFFYFYLPPARPPRGGRGKTRGAIEERASDEREVIFWGAAPMQRQLLVNEESILGGIRDITPNLIHHSQGLTVPIYVVLQEESRVYDPESISDL